MNENRVQKALVVRSNIEKKGSYLDYREELRFDFWYACAYCSITEIEAGGIGFEIDHYYPQKKHPELRNSYDNLMYSCDRCNRFKLDYDPNEKAQTLGFVVLRPDQDDPRAHYELERYRLNGKTQKGKFSIELLNLNRKGLRRLREIREKMSESKEYLLVAFVNWCNFQNV